MTKKNEPPKADPKSTLPRLLPLGKYIPVPWTTVRRTTVPVLHTEHAKTGPTTDNRVEIYIHADGKDSNTLDFAIENGKIEQL